jgi:hypothetical protein
MNNAGTSLIQQLHPIHQTQLQAPVHLSKTQLPASHYQTCIHLTQLCSNKDCSCWVRQAYMFHSTRQITQKLAWHICSKSLHQPLQLHRPKLICCNCRGQCHHMPHAVLQSCTADDP